MMTSLLLLLVTIFIFGFLLSRAKRYSNRLPPGSLGLPLIGQTLGLIKAMKTDNVEEWFHERIAKHGPMSKARVFGYPTIILCGANANKFIYTYDGNKLTNKQPSWISRILGKKTILEMTGDDHKRVRSALVSFLKLEVLKQYVVKVDEEIQNHLETHWHGKSQIQVRPIIKTLTFNVICSLLFGIERGPKREELLPLFHDMIRSMESIPLNIPFTQFNRGLKARKKVVTVLLDLISEKREAIKVEKQGSNSPKDLITSLLNIRNDDGSTSMSDEEIIDNIIIVMFAGYDTTAILLTFLIRLLAYNKYIYSNIAQEQEEISKSKAQGEALTWEDLTKMKYTWRVASEALRVNLPVDLTFRRAHEDIEYGGYIIPKGWQVILCASLTHMDDSIFRNPTMFDPSHFEKDAPTPPPFSYLVFGAGPRMCPGMEFAKMETLTMIHRLVTHFKWELLKKQVSFKRIQMPESAHDLFVRIKPMKET